MEVRHEVGTRLVAQRAGTQGRAAVWRREQRRTDAPPVEQQAGHEAPRPWRGARREATVGDDNVEARAHLEHDHLNHHDGR